jgi:hypothetical protein
MRIAPDELLTQPNKTTVVGGTFASPEAGNCWAVAGKTQQVMRDNTQARMLIRSTTHLLFGFSIS